MDDLPAYLAFQVKVLLGFYRPVPLLTAHLLLSLVGAVALQRLQQFWGDFALSYSLLIMTCLWFMDTVLGICQSIRDRAFSPSALGRGCGKWLLWVTILFVGYALATLDPMLNLVAHTLEMAVILTQSLYVVRGAAELLDNPLADKLLQVFEGRLEQRLQQILDELGEARAIAEEVRDTQARMNGDGGSHE